MSRLKAENTVSEVQHLLDHMWQAYEEWQHFVHGPAKCKVVKNIWIRAFWSLEDVEGFINCFKWGLIKEGW